MDAVDNVLAGKEWISVYGVGYVGLSLISVYLRHGMKVIGVDKNEDRLRFIESGNFACIEQKICNAIKTGLRENRLVLTSSGIDASKKSAIKVVTVPVYVKWPSKSIDYSSFLMALRDIGKGIKSGDLVIVESSVPPGFTQEIVLPILEDVSNLKAEEDIFIAYSPERIYVGRAVDDIELNYPKIVSGVGKKSLDMVAKLYSRIAKKGVIRMSSTTAAEFEKLAEGVYRDVNIALANELALAAMRLGVDYYEIRRAANSQPYCHLHLPGPGVGGYCIPIYPYFMMKQVLRKNMFMRLTYTARKINEGMPAEVLNILYEIMDKHGISSRERDIKIAILGVAFRGNVDDTRLSPALDVIALLKSHGYKRIVAHDPFVKDDKKLIELEIELLSDLRSVLEGADVVIVTARHNMYRELNLSQILEMSGRQPLVFDTVNVINVDIDYPKVIILGKAPSDISLDYIL